MRPYDHIERYGSDEVEGIDIGTVYVFPKLDGANGRVALMDGKLRAGSRTRVLSEDHGELQGFMGHVAEHQPKLVNFLAWIAGNCNNGVLDGLTVYGEWLVPHTLRTYREDAWKRFWIFDVHNGERFLPFDEWAPVAESLGLDIVQPLCTITDPTPDQVQAQVLTNTFLIADGAGLGEGIVLKNFQWKNKYGRQPWAKIVRNEFKETNRRVFGTTEKDGASQVEKDIARAAVTQALVAKERAKIEAEVTDRKVVIPRLLETVFHCVVTEELWTPLKKSGFPTVDFKRLRAFCIALTKEHASDLF